MILFLDDNPNRAALAYQRMTPDARDHTIWCKTAPEAISVLRDYAKVLVQARLDHDLEGDGAQNSFDKNCGMAVVRYLESLDDDGLNTIRGCHFIVHSWNPPAGREMTERIEKLGLKAVYTPFGT
jgi:hypothetical protein